FVKRRPVGGAGYRRPNPNRATPFLRLHEKFLTVSLFTEAEAGFGVRERSSDGSGQRFPAN
ncbi:hypothetical protein MCW82_25545, partial [Azospirillum doebereinerae]